VFKIKVVHEVKTHILCPDDYYYYYYYYYYENRAVHEIMWKSCGDQQATDDNIIRRMRFACWMSVATHTHTIGLCNTFPWQHWLRERASLLRYTYIACLIGLIRMFVTEFVLFPYGKVLRFV
jgi:hypothetical protein